MDISQGIENLHNAGMDEEAEAVIKLQSDAGWLQQILEKLVTEAQQNRDEVIAGLGQMSERLQRIEARLGAIE